MQESGAPITTSKKLNDECSNHTHVSLLSIAVIIQELKNLFQGIIILQINHFYPISINRNTY